MARKDPAAVELGRKGGKVSSEAKAVAARKNGKLGGRPKQRKIVDETLLGIPRSERARLRNGRV